jgi:hypothetical protein
MTTSEHTTADGKNQTDDHWTERLPNARSGPESEALETFVETPMDTHTRCDCETHVRGWHDCGFAAVSIIVDIDAAEPLEVSLGVDEARQLASELHKATTDAERLVDGWATQTSEE